MLEGDAPRIDDLFADHDSQAQPLLVTGRFHVGMLSMAQRETLAALLAEGLAPSLSAAIANKEGIPVEDVSESQIMGAVIHQKNPIVVNLLRISMEDVRNLSVQPESIDEDDYSVPMVVRKDSGLEVLTGHAVLADAIEAGAESIDAVDLSSLINMDWQSYLDGAISGDMPVRSNISLPGDAIAARPWSGRTVVATESGTPKTVFHGSRSTVEIDDFLGITYFAEHEGFARTFGAERVYPVELDITNPHIVDGTTSGRHFDWDFADIQEMISAGHDGIIVRHPEGDIYVPFEPNQVRHALSPSLKPRHDPTLGVTSVADYYGDKGARQLAHAAKEGDIQSIRAMAARMAEAIPPGATLVPVPSRTGEATACLLLANEIAALTGAPVVDALSGNDRPSLYAVKASGQSLSTAAFGFQLKADPGHSPVLVDNVFATGTTLAAIRTVIPQAPIVVFARDTTAAVTPLLSVSSRQPASSALLDTATPVIQAEASPLFQRRTIADVRFVDEASTAAALEKDAVARKIIAKGIEVNDGELVGVRLNINVLKSTGVAVQTLHAGTPGIRKKMESNPQGGSGFYDGSVLAYQNAVTLRNAYFNVNQKRREEIASGASSKTPMGSVDGAFVKTSNHNFDGIELRFNPHREHLFIDKYGRSVRYADEITVVGNSGYARGTIQYFDANNYPGPAGPSKTAAVPYAANTDDLDPVFRRGFRGFVGMDMESVTATVNEIMANWHNAPPVTVVGSVSDLPFPAPFDAEGAYFNGTVYLVADNLPSRDHCEFVLLHESLGHHGLRGVLGSDIESHLQTLYQADPVLRTRVNAFMTANAGYSVPAATEEVLADMAASGVERLKGLPRFLAAVKHQIRRLGFNIALSGKDTLYLVEKAGAYTIASGHPADKATTVVRSEVARFMAGWHQVTSSITGKASLIVGTFYSALSEAAKSMRQERGTPEQMLAMLAKTPGVKMAEIEATGLKDFLQLQEGQVTRAQISEYLTANRVQLVETQYGGDVESMLQIANRYGYTVDENPMDGELQFFNEDLDEVEFEDLPAEIQTAFNGLQAPKYAGQQLSGERSGYREIVLSLPLAAGPDEGTVIEFPDDQATESFLVDVSAAGYEHLDYGRVASNPLAVEFDRPLPAALFPLVSDNRGTIINGHDAAGSTYAGKHFDIPNAVGHVRLNVRTDADGRKTVFVEEFQSDWAQDGRRHGFDRGIRPAEVSVTKIENGFSVLVDGQPVWAGVDENKANLEAERQKAKNPVSNGVPSGPFVGNTDAWVSLLMRKVIAVAVDLEADAVAWTTGEQQVDRYKLSKHISEVIVMEMPEGDWNLRAFAVEGEEERSIDVDIDDLSKLDHYVGKDLGEKIRREIVGNGAVTFKGLDLDVGGDGMLAFYDGIVPKVAKAVIGKMGSQLSSIDLGLTEKGQPGFVINEEMRATVKSVGQPLFSRASYRASGTDNVFDIKNASTDRWLKDPETIAKIAFLVDMRITHDLEKLVGPIDTDAKEALLETWYCSDAIRMNEYETRDLTFSEMEDAYLSDVQKHLTSTGDNVNAKDMVRILAKMSTSLETFLEWAIDQPTLKEVAEPVFRAYAPDAYDSVIEAKKEACEVIDFIAARDARHPRPLGADVLSIDVDGQQRPTRNSMGQPIFNTEAGVRNFWRWFGDSKTVDHEGRPLVFYHGTQSSVDAFDSQKISSRFPFSFGFHFTSSQTEASIYADSIENAAVEFNPASPFARPVADGANVMPVYLRTEQPLQYQSNHITASIEADRNRATIIADLANAKGEGRQHDAVIINAGSGEYANTNVIVFDSTQVKSALGNTGNFSNDHVNVLYQPAYHGTPHRFSSFSLAHIGTGESNAMFGWGLYFASSKEVAEHYRSSLSLRNADALQRHALDSGLQPELADAMAQFYSSAKVSSYESFAAIAMSESPSEYINLFREKYIRPSILDGSAKAVWDSFVKAGHVYTVDIPDDGYLLWDEPYSKQPPIVLEALKKFEIMTYSPVPPDTTGEEIYQMLVDHEDIGSQEHASRFLSSCGVPGIKYLDGFSRSTGGDSYNFVVFDEDAITILETHHQTESYFDAGVHAHNARVEIRTGATRTEYMINLFETANESTFIHEAGHVWLDIYEKLAAAPDAPSVIKQDVAILKKWMGIPENATIDRAGHEKFAKAIEVYVATGNPPVKTLDGVFSGFRSWLGDLYSKLSFKENISVNPEVRAVMDRMMGADLGVDVVRTEHSARLGNRLAGDANHMTRHRNSESLNKANTFTGQLFAHFFDTLKARGLAESSLAEQFVIRVAPPPPPSVAQAAGPDFKTLTDRADRFISVDGIMRPTEMSNGQLIHSTIEGIKNFWTWFGDSKATDKDGRPLAVWHGTDEKGITEFKAGRETCRFLMMSKFDAESQGHFFSESDEDAVGYGKNIIPATLRITNPLTPINDIGMDCISLSAAKRVLADYQYILSPLIETQDGEKVIDLMGEQFFRVTDEMLESGQWVRELADHQLHWSIFDNPDVVRRMLECGYDGAIAYEPNDASRRSYFVLDSNQIKSATANAGSFSPSSANIYYQSDSVNGHNEGVSTQPSGATPHLHAIKHRLRAFDEQMNPPPSAGQGPTFR